MNKHLNSLGTKAGLMQAAMENVTHTIGCVFSSNGVNIYMS